MEIRAKILTQARDAVLNSRAATHGDAERNFNMIARVWSVRLGVDITAAQVALMMIDLKTSRAWENPKHEDSWVDIAGYAACGAELSLDTTLGGVSMEAEKPEYEK